MNPSDQARWQGSVDSWLAQGGAANCATNPGSGGLIADTGQLTAGWYDFWVVFIANTALYRAQVEHRNAANAATLFNFYGSYSTSNAPSLPILNWKMAENERLRVVSISSQAGVYCASIHWVRRA